MDANYSGVVAANGTCVVEIRASARMNWQVSQVSTELTSAPAGSTSMLRKNGSLISSLVSPGDVADGVPAAELQGGDVMTVEWAGCTPNTIAKVYIIYTESPV